MWKVLLNVVIGLSCVFCSWGSCFISRLILFWVFFGCGRCVFLVDLSSWVSLYGVRLVSIVVVVICLLRLCC